MSLGSYLAVSAIFGEADYGGHVVETEGIAPLGLALLAAFMVTVGVVGVANPRLLPVPLLAWLTVALVFGMFGSNAIYGINLFSHHSVVETTSDYRGALSAYLHSDALPGGGRDSPVSPNLFCSPEIWMIQKPKPPWNITCPSCRTAVPKRG